MKAGMEGVFSTTDLAAPQTLCLSSTMSANEKLGTLEIGILLSGVLFGVVTCQVYVYHKNFPKDPLWLQIGLVDGIWLMELAHTICTFHALYIYTVTENGNPVALIAAPKSLGTAVLLHGLIIVLVQGYFTYRIYIFSPKPYLVPIFSVLLILAQLVTVVTLAVMAVTVASVSIALYLEEWGTLLVVTLWLRVAADLTISSSLVYFLIKQRNHAYRSTVLIVDKLIRWTIETGVITSVVGIALVTNFLVNTDNLVWLALLLILPKVFSNTLMANINSRTALRNIQSSVHVGTIGSSFGIGGNGGGMSVQGPMGGLSTNLNVTVTTELETLNASQTKSHQWHVEPDKYVEAV
ncbi:hypothetical protein D9757_011020 [Collybiopsis confluens]|uniref:DUF6534 domain-containing protein n=1 Tax=Collybiopsis confluens TaxID=2823264 RepID=A0A8H5LML4_9AGAR|nr:hypothetical protein D9757_011020 [Collybiopsis confluens]